MQDIPKFLEDPGESERIGKKSEKIRENTKKFQSTEKIQEDTKESERNLENP